VWIAARDRGRGVGAAESIGARFVELDVTDEASVAAAADVVARAGGLDVLINNAGIVGPRPQVPETTAEDVRTTFETNVFGPVCVVRAFTDLLDASVAPVVVNVSSGIGSLGYASDPNGPAAAILLLGYSSSKAALDMLTIKWARAHPRWRVNAADPGFTATDLNSHRGTQTVQEGTDAIVRLACVTPDGPTGTFADRHGTVPW
jgi:NAD(P)-dependent dehydrogenase (short-subunit alcohol dehydrogenase family)